MRLGSLFVAAACVATGEDFPNRVIITFDTNCVKDGASSLNDYMKISTAGVAILVGLGNILGDLIQTILDTIFGPIIDLNQREDSARKNNNPDRARSLFPDLNRPMSDTPSGQREDEIMATLHMMAVLDYTNGDTEKAESIIKAETQRRSASDPYPVITTQRALEYIQGMRIIDSPLSEGRILSYANMLPCLRVEPVVDRIIPPAPILDLKKSQAAMKKHATPMSTPEMYSFLDEVTPDVIMKRLTDEKKSGTPSFDNYGLTNQTFKMAPMTDGSVKNPYHILTYRGGSGDSWGAGANSAWLQLAKDALFEQNPELSQQGNVTVEYSQLISAIQSKYEPPVVAVLDTGCYQHADLKPQFWRYDAMPGCKGDAVVGTGGDIDKNGYANTCIGYDISEKQPDPTIDIPSNHGTAVSGLILGVGDNEVGSVGMCPWCKLMCLKIANAHGTQYVSSAVTAIDYALAYGAKITNHSYGAFSPENPNDPEYIAHQTLGAAGVFQAASAGNGGCNSEVTSGDCTDVGSEHTPSGYGLPSLMSVGAINEAGEKAYYSDYGKTSVDLFAPGDLMDVISGAASTRGDTDVVGSGTSYASPVVAGIAAIIMTKYPDMSADDVVTAMKNSAIPNSALEGKADVAGVVQANRALAYADYMVLHPTTSTTRGTGTTVAEETTVAAASADTTTTTKRKCHC